MAIATAKNAGSKNGFAATNVLAWRIGKHCCKIFATTSLSMKRAVGIGKVFAISVMERSIA
jgi:hypothetical protein